MHLSEQEMIQHLIYTSAILSLFAGDYDLTITDSPVYSFLTANPQDILILELSDYLMN